jgi:transcription antitermination factor NusG
MSRQWFVGITKQGQETLAKRELENQEFGTYLPMCISEWARRPRIRPFLATYIFIQLDPVNERWRSVWSTRGMSSRPILLSGDHPQPIYDWVIDGIKEREVDGLVRLPPKAQCKFHKGDRVAIRGNPIDALFEEVVDYRRAVVFLSLLGRANRLIVPLSKLTTAPIVGVAAVA